MLRAAWSSAAAGYVCAAAILFLASARAFAAAPAAEPLPTGLALANVISDHMVLQRDLAAPVWGMDVPGEKVTVEFAGQSKTAVADEKGTWRVKLDSMPASAEPRVLTIRDSKQKVQIADVLVGDVWIGAGQSNMKWFVSESKPRSDPPLHEMAQKSYPAVRFRYSLPAQPFRTDP
jgi:sialate O-acetylesterase